MAETLNTWYRRTHTTSDEHGVRWVDESLMSPNPNRDVIYADINGDRVSFELELDDEGDVMAVRVNATSGTPVIVPKAGNEFRIERRG